MIKYTFSMFLLKNIEFNKCPLNVCYMWNTSYLKEKQQKTRLLLYGLYILMVDYYNYCIKQNKMNVTREYKDT